MTYQELLNAIMAMPVEARRQEAMAMLPGDGIDGCKPVMLAPVLGAATARDWDIDRSVGSSGQPHDPDQWVILTDHNLCDEHGDLDIEDLDRSNP